MRKIAFNLSEDSLTKAVEQMKAYKAEIHKKAQLLVERLTDYGLTICRAKVIEMDIPDTGHLLSQVDGYYSPLLNAGFIFCDCDYAVFVEFGTGVKGTSQPYAGQAISECGYQYMGGTHYITTQDGRIGWFYPADDGTWKFTQGMPSRPFMYETGLEMRNTLDNIIKEVFK
jgi:hypothetical protein